MRKSVVRLCAASLALTAGLGLGAGTAVSAHADTSQFLEYCKAMFGSQEPLLYQGVDDMLSVQALQCELNAWGANLTQDGKFGPNTYNEVVWFQQVYHLQVDGVVGYYTWRALDYRISHMDA